MSSCVDYRSWWEKHCVNDVPTNPYSPFCSICYFFSSSLFFQNKDANMSRGHCETSVNLVEDFSKCRNPNQRDVKSEGKATVWELELRLKYEGAIFTCLNRLTGNNRKQASPFRSHSGISGICFGTNKPLPDPFPGLVLWKQKHKFARLRGVGLMSLNVSALKVTVAIFVSPHGRNVDMFKFMQRFIQHWLLMSWAGIPSDSHSDDFPWRFWLLVLIHVTIFSYELFLMVCVVWCHLVFSIGSRHFGVLIIKSWHKYFQQKHDATFW